MKKRIGEIITGVGLLGYLIMGSALDGQNWQLALGLAVLFLVIGIIGYKVYDSCLKLEKDEEAAEKILEEAVKAENREILWKAWLATK